MAISVGSKPIAPAKTAPTTTDDWMADNAKQLVAKYGTPDPTTTAAELKKATAAAGSYVPSSAALRDNLLWSSVNAEPDLTKATDQARKNISDALGKGPDGTRRQQLFDAILHTTVLRAEPKDPSEAIEILKGNDVTDPKALESYYRRGKQDTKVGGLSSKDFEAVAKAISHELSGNATKRNTGAAADTAFENAYAKNAAALALDLKKRIEADPKSVSPKELEQARDFVGAKWLTLGAWNGPLGPSMAVLNSLRDLAKGADAPASAPVKDAVATSVKPTRTAEQRNVDDKRTADGHKALASHKPKKGLGFETTDAPAKADGADAAATASSPADLASVVQSAQASLERADGLLESLPQELKQQTADAMNGYGKVPAAAMGAYQQAMAAFSDIDQSVAKLPKDDQKAFYAQFGINYDVSMQLTEQAQGGATPAAAPGVKPPPTPNMNSGNSAADMTLGSRVSSLNRTQLLPTPTTTPLAPQPDSRARPPSAQLKDIVVKRLLFAGIQPTNLVPINWDNPQAQPSGVPYDGALDQMINQLGRPNAQNAAAWNQQADAITRAQAQGLANNGAGVQNVMSGDEMRQLLSQKDTNPVTLAQQIIAKKSPMQGRLTQDAIGALVEGLDPATVKTKAQAKQYVDLIQGLRDLMPSLPVGVGAMPQGYQVPQQTMPFGMFGNGAVTGAMATMGAGFMPTGNTAFDLANAVANAPAFSQSEQALLSQIQDPQQRAMQALQMFMQKQALLATTLSNIANMRHEMMKTVANNLRA